MKSLAKGWKWLLGGVLTLLGFSGCEELGIMRCEYGQPLADYKLIGDVKDTKGNPIKGIPRHPILEDDVIVYSNATVLGRITLAKGTVIGGNVWVTESTKPGEQIVQAKKRKSQLVRPEDWGGL